MVTHLRRTMQLVMSSFVQMTRLGSAGTKSIFHDTNKSQLEAEYGVKIISSFDASQL